ncbi:hypothetical protein MPL3365_140227 [Mesorhizobium plurifarium]|uniref:Uncharacterized protein n=1 Tax=Mesorhizobium plurifarium TaxID=69974 RepID=A0A090FXQ3_MESPL|nr:hypothetical protein MPL3365_140227 [Mesorhizobium plurifarium]
MTFDMTGCWAATSCRRLEVLFPVSLLQGVGYVLAKQLPGGDGDVETDACPLLIDHRDHRAAVGVFERVKNVVNEEISLVGHRAGLIFHGLPPSKISGSWLSQQSCSRLSSDSCRSLNM